MAVVLDTNMKLFAERMNITSSRMIQDYGLKTVEEIIEAEAAQGNTQAVQYAREMSQPAVMFVGLLTLGVVGLALDLVVKWLEKKLIYWS